MEDKYNDPKNLTKTGNTLGGLLMIAGLFLIFPIPIINRILGAFLIASGLLYISAMMKIDRNLPKQKPNKVVDEYLATPEFIKAQEKTILFKDALINKKQNGNVSKEEYIADMLLSEEINRKAWEIVYKKYPDLKGKNLNYNKETKSITVLK